MTTTPPARAADDPSAGRATAPQRATQRTTAPRSPAPAASQPTGAATTASTTATPAPQSPASAAPPNRVMGYRRQRFEARKVRRLIRHIDPWSMLKLSVMVALCLWLITMIASVILWTVAKNAGTISSVEDFVNSTFQLQDWKLDGEFLFRQFGLVTLLFHLGIAGALVVATLVFNLISDIIGGIWISVIEEETARPVSETGGR